jgi:predicted RNase H-like HicB family nuclease
MDARYYSLIRRTRDGLFVGWIPDLPGVTASAVTEDEVIHELSRSARELLNKMTRKGLSFPASSPVDELALGDHLGLYRRLLLILSGRS